MSNELKPCPFCGAEPIMQEHEPHTHSQFLKDAGIPDHSGSFTVECPTENCCGMIADTREAVTAAWNRRTSDRPSVAEQELAALLTKYSMMKNAYDTEIAHLRKSLASDRSSDDVENKPDFGKYRWTGLSDHFDPATSDHPSSTKEPK